MAHPQLDNLVRIGQLKTEPAAEEEIEGLLRSGQRRLDDAERKELSLESRFDLGYNAAHALALAALRAHGYRSDWRTAIAPIRAIWSFNACSTPSACLVNSGECWTRPTASAILPSMKERWT